MRNRIVEVIVCGAVVAGAAGIVGCTSGGGDPETATPPAAGTATDEIQSQRKELLESLKQKRIIQKISTPGTTPRVYVLPAFSLLTFDEKSSFISVCYAYAYALPQGDIGDFDEPLFVYDAMSDKNIGSFSPQWGLSL